MNRRPSTRIVRTGSASRGGLFIKQPDPNEGYTFQSGQVENTGQEQAQTGGNTMNESNLVNDPRITYLGGTYTPDEDVTATLSDGRTIQLALKGTPMPLSEAVAKGLVDEKGNPVKQQKAAGPSENKETPKKPATQPAEGSAPSQSAPANEKGK